MLFFLLLLEKGLINQEEYNSIISSLDSADFMNIYYRQRKGSKRRGFINNNIGFRGFPRFGPRHFPGFGYNFGFNHFHFPHPHGMFGPHMNPRNININPPPQNQNMNKGYSSNNQPNNQINNEQNMNNGYTSNNQPNNQINNNQNNYTSNYSNNNQIM